MGFRKINTQEEIRKATEKKPELDAYIKQADTQYKLIKEIVEYRKCVGITQKEVAERSGLTQQMVSRMEKIDNSPTLENFLRYVLALGLELKVEKANIQGVSSGEEAFCVF
jgi:HTH-type transcriptional regulator / antitoxin HipB